MGRRHTSELSARLPIGRSRNREEAFFGILGEEANFGTLAGEEVRGTTAGRSASFKSTHHGFRAGTQFAPSGAGTKRPFGDRRGTVGTPQQRCSPLYGRGTLPTGRKYRLPSNDGEPGFEARTNAGSPVLFCYSKIEHMQHNNTPPQGRHNFHSIVEAKFFQGFFSLFRLSASTNVTAESP